LDAYFVELPIRQLPTCISINMQTYQVSAGDVVFIPEGAPHWYQDNGDEDFDFRRIIPNKKDELMMVDDKNC
jgi:quercetin dioxygenase-like cupin family protein